MKICNRLANYSELRHSFPHWNSGLRIIEALFPNDNSLRITITTFALMEKLIEYILRFGNLNKQQIDLIISRATEIELKKDDYFVEAGKMFNQVVFMLEGVLRICYYDNQGTEITKYFVDENNLIAYRLPYITFAEKVE